VTDTIELRRRGGRQRAFDPDEALDAAMRLFWMHGYEATSLAMLRDTLGLTPPQIYNAFKDKETLFRLALDRYLQIEAAFAIAALSAPVSTLSALRQLLIGAAQAYSAPGKPGGCLYVAGALAASPQAHAIAEELRVRRKGTEAAIIDRLKRGQDEGDVPPDVDVKGTAKFLTATIHGMSVQARDGASASELEAVADFAISAVAARFQAKPGPTDALTGTKLRGAP
jgi:AcrR family transcriptional regulator